MRKTLVALLGTTLLTGTLAQPVLASDKGTPKHQPAAAYQCSDGIDNDEDKLIDMKDPNCKNPTDNTEAQQAFFEIGYHTDYIFRGLRFGDESMQTSATGCYNNACATVWTNYDFRSQELNEADFIGDYTHTLNEIKDANGEVLTSTALTGTFNHIVSPSDAYDDTTEVALKLSHTRPFGDFAIEGAYDFDESGGWNLEASLTKSFGPTTWTLAGGHNHHYWLFDDTGKEVTGEYANLTLTVPFEFSGQSLEGYVTAQDGADPFEDTVFGGLRAKW